MKKRNLLSALCAMVMSVGSAHASMVTINFDNFTSGTLLNTAYSGLGLTFNSSAALIQGGGGVTSQPNFAVGSSQNFYTPLELIFDNYATSVGAFNVSGSSFTLSAFDLNGLLLGSGSTSTFGDQVLLSGIGNIKTARFTTTFQYGIDDLSFNTAASNVPEPGSIALVALGLIGFSAVRRKKDSKQA